MTDTGSSAETRARWAAAHEQAVDLCLRHVIAAETARVLSLRARRLRIDAAGVGITAARLRVEAGAV